VTSPSPVRSGAPRGPDALKARLAGATIGRMAALLWLFIASFLIAMTGLAFSLAAVRATRSREDALGAIRSGSAALIVALLNSVHFAGWISPSDGFRQWEASAVVLRAAAAAITVVAAVAYALAAARPNGNEAARRHAWTSAALHGAVGLALAFTIRLPIAFLAISNAYLACSGISLIMRPFIGSSLARNPDGSDPASDAPPVSDRAMDRAGRSAREREIVALLNRGMASKEIAHSLRIASITVKNHVYNIYQKTGVKNRVELLNLCRQDPPDRSRSGT